MSLRRFLREEEGATTIEYGLIASVFVLMAMLGWTYLGKAMSEMYGDMSTSIVDAGK